MLGRIAMVAGVAMSITMAGTTYGQASDTTLHVKGLKSPELAEALGIFPGGGEFYAGDWRGGLKGYFGTVFTVGAGVTTILLGELQGCNPDPFVYCHPHGSVWPTRIAGGAVVAAGIGFWGYEAVSAGRLVRRNNARKIEAARDTVRSPKLTDVHAFVVPAPLTRSVALGVHASW